MKIEADILSSLRKLLLTPDPKEAVKQNPADVKVVVKRLQFLQGRTKEKLGGYAPLFAAALEVMLTKSELEGDKVIDWCYSDQFSDLIASTRHDAQVQSRAVKLLGKFIEMADAKNVDLCRTLYSLAGASSAVPSNTIIERDFCKFFQQGLDKCTLAKPGMAADLVSDILQAKVACSKAISEVVKASAPAAYHADAPEHYPAPNALEAFRVIYLDAPVIK